MVRLGDSHITVYADMHTSASTVKSIIKSLCEILNIIVILINTDRVYKMMEHIVLGLVSIRHINTI